MMQKLWLKWMFAVSVLSWACLLSPTLLAASGAKAFDTPQLAAEALIDAAARFDVSALQQIFGPNEDSIFLSGERPLDRQRAADFAVRAREKHSVDTDPQDAKRMLLVVGAASWPFPVPIVKREAKWSYDAE